MERYEVRTSELHLAFDPEQEGLTAVYLASEVDAYRSETGATIHALQKSHERYEKLHRLSPREFHSLWMQTVGLSEKFDEVLDRLPS